MKKEESIQELSDDELTEKLKSVKEELFNLRFQHATGQLDNPSKIRQAKKQIARILTAMRQAELSALGLSKVEIK